MNCHKYKMHQDALILLMIWVCEPGFLSFLHLPVCVCGLLQCRPDSQGEDDAEEGPAYEVAKKREGSF